MAKTKNIMKWNFAIGTTSRVPYCKRLHYFIADFDCEKLPDNVIENISYWSKHVFIQKTKNGYHVYTDCKLTFNSLVKKLRHCKADKKWVSIGKKRGYFFLADKSHVILPWHVERMVLNYNGKER